MHWRLVSPKAWRVILGATLALAVVIPASAQQVAQVQQTRTLIPADSSAGARYMDIMDVDQQANLMYFGDSYRGGVDIWDVSGPNPIYVTTVGNDSGGAGGVIVAKNVNKVFAGEHPIGVGVIDIDPSSSTFNKQIKAIPTGGSADEIDYDSADMKVYVAHRNEGFVAAIDAVNLVVVNTITGLGGALEQPRYNAGDGYVYDISGTDNVVYRIDPKTDTLVQTFDIGDPCNPSGLAINPKTNQGILSCRNVADQHAVFWDMEAGQVIGSTHATGGGDSIVYDAKVDRFFEGNDRFPDGSNTVPGSAPNVGIFTGTPIAYLTSVPATNASHSVTYGETSNMIYTPYIDNGRPGILSFPLPTH